MRGTLSPAARSVLRILSDGEWHTVPLERRAVIAVLEDAGLVYRGTIDERLAAIATDAGLERYRVEVAHA